MRTNHADPVPNTFRTEQERHLARLRIEFVIVRQELLQTKITDIAGEERILRNPRSEMEQFVSLFLL